MCIGNPYDAIATKGTKSLYLEAKGTQTTGGHVLVSSRRLGYPNSGPAIVRARSLRGGTLRPFFLQSG